MTDLGKILTPEFWADAAANIDRRPAPDVDATRVDIYDDMARKEVDGKVYIIPQPTLGFLFLYAEQAAKFWEPKKGIGRLRWALIRRERVREIRAGMDIPDKESAALDVPESEAPIYLSMVHEAQKKTVAAIQDEGDGTLGPAGAFAQLIEFTHYDIDRLVYQMSYVAFIGLLQGMYDLSEERKRASEDKGDGDGAA